MNAARNTLVSASPELSNIFSYHQLQIVTTLHQSIHVISAEIIDIF
ncbi:MAG: hypothetical protein ACJA0Z_003512 [Halioglobus sp.]|jgi:hypothetical protein